MKKIGWDTLQNVTLDDLYKDKEIMGYTLKKGYVPKMLNAGEAIKRITESTFLQSTSKKSYPKSKLNYPEFQN